MIAKTYSPADVEAKWYQRWQEKGFFQAHVNPRKQPYTVVIPPPNVTGVLHMGHMLNNTIQDVLVRRARMQGKEACWVPGTDHASIATEAKVVAMLKEQGINKHDLSREDFLTHAWAWKEKYGGIILEQLKQLGASCDWRRTRFTMEPQLTEAVLRVFVDLYKKDLIYRGVRMVNWDPKGQTALSDEEVIPVEKSGKMYYVRYELDGEEGKYLTIATSRPETIMADVAIAVNPNDERYQHLVGKNAILPTAPFRRLPIIFDDYVSTDFGTGALKVTPAHDLNDYQIGLRHQLPVIDILNEDGTLNSQGFLYEGLDRDKARKEIVKHLQEAGKLEKVEEYKTTVQTSERTNAVVEPRLSMQWFLKMEHLAKPALEVVENGTIQLHPPKFKNMYRVWMENVRDWCVSRQLWWGQRIPAWYGFKPGGSWTQGDPLPGDFDVRNPTSGLFHLEVALNEQQALEQFKVYYQELGFNEQQVHQALQWVSQDKDVLDTWFSSWLWPISVFNGFDDPDNPDINYFYPTNDLVTAPEILFFWVARMVMAGLEYRREVPFRNVYLTGIVRDAQGRKMSKQLGNSPDPLDLIRDFGADAVRTGMLFSSPAGNDLLYDQKLIDQGRNFNNKLWNAFRLVKGWETDAALPFANAQAVAWFEARLAQVLTELNEHFDKFRMSDALLAVYKLVWDDFCSYYLEMVKPAYQQPVDAQTLQATVGFLETLLKLLHPFMPFITEELWHALAERGERDYVCVAYWPKLSAPARSAEVLAQMERALAVVAGVRNVRNQKNIGPTKQVALAVKTDDPTATEPYAALISKLANLSDLTFVDAAPTGAVSFVQGSAEFFVPLDTQVDAAAERERLQKDLTYSLGFRDSVQKKLGNEKFVANAKPAVLENERQKLADAEAKIAALEQALRAL